jgi:hypothetical protein
VDCRNQLGAFEKALDSTTGSRMYKLARADLVVYMFVFSEGKILFVSIKK